MSYKKIVSPGKETEPLDVVRSGETDKAFGEYFSGGKIFEQVQKRLRERNYRVANLTPTYRILDHWEEKGLMPDHAELHKPHWRKFNLVEVAWLEAVSVLREFGLSLEKISLVKSKVLNWHDGKETYAEFEYFLAMSVLRPEDPYLAVSTSGQAVLATSAEIETLKLGGHAHHLILVSLKSIMHKLGFNVQKPELLFSLNSEEEVLLKNIRLKENKKIELSLAKNRIKEILTTEVYKDHPPLGKIDKSFKDDEEFGEVVSRYENGVKQSAEVKKRKRF